MKVMCIVQARMTSTRLPQKVLMEIKGIPVIGLILRALDKCSSIDKILVATTTNIQDDILVKYLHENNRKYFRGSEKDVLERFVLAAEKYNPDFIVRITADCPLVDPFIVDKVIEKAIIDDADYASNILKRTFPDGYDVEVIKFPILKKIYQNTEDPFDREHVTQYIINNKENFKIVNLEAPEGMMHPEWRVTLDYIEDYDLIKKIYEFFPKDYVILLDDITKIFSVHPELIRNNSMYSLYK